MTRLNFDRRDNETLILVDASGREYTIEATQALMEAARTALGRQAGTAKVNPAKVQRLLRKGHTVEEIADLTGYEVTAIARFEPPVRAELDYLLERAHSVPVRTASSRGGETERFGDVIADRLVNIAATEVAWKAAKDEEKGWTIALEFKSYDVSHRAVWLFDSAKLLLTPDTADAIKLSKQEDPSEQLIPKLRAVQPEAPAAEPAAPAAPIATIEPIAELPAVSETHDTASYETFSLHQDNTGAQPDLNETQDLLEALRRRRGEREQAREQNNQTGSQQTFEIAAETPEEPAETEAVWESAHFGDKPRHHDIDAAIAETDRAAATPFARDELTAAAARPVEQAQPNEPNTHAETATETADNDSENGKTDAKKRGRASMPSWDQILFGTRSDD
ncbi:MAG: septation protein SepH [Microbacteriaceae bacterium]|nr:septation protein SepH [Microbacteriaceae bacterium]